jgi:hypothetical protein
MVKLSLLTIIQETSWLMNGQKRDVPSLQYSRWEIQISIIVDVREGMAPCGTHHLPPAARYDSRLFISTTFYYNSFPKSTFPEARIQASDSKTRIASSNECVDS